jgi:flagellar biosynthesis chaperone FliJ
MMAALFAAGLLQAAPLPVKRVVVYKNGVAFYERSGTVKAGEAATLDFRAAELDDVLKSLVLDAPGGVQRVRYEFTDPARAGDPPRMIQVNPQQPLVHLLDQWRGARLEMKFRANPVSGIIVSGRLAPLPNQGEKQELTLLLDSGSLASFDLDAASDIRLADPRLQQQFSDALARMARDLTPDRRTVHVDLAGSGERRLTARYLAPAPVWKSTYRLLLPDAGEATLEGWAIVENTTGEDWNQVALSVVSGKPVSFLTRLLEARYVQRRVVELPGIEPVAPQTHAAGVVGGALPPPQMARADAARTSRMMAMAAGPMAETAEAKAAPAPLEMEMSTVDSAAEGREAGELFEYSFSTPVNARAGESLLLPFFQGKITARRLLIYSDRSQANPRHAAEITNSTGKTLDGGPITVYHSSGYSGEALMEVLKSGEKRLISYAVDQAVRVTTNFDSGEEMIRSFRASRGVLTTRTALVRTTVYTVSNADAKEKSLLIEHAVTPGWKLVKPKADETTTASYRFSVVLPAQGSAKLAVAEEREMESSTAVTSLTPDILFRYTQNRSLSAAARQQLEAIAAKKREIAEADSEQRRTETELRELSGEQERLRQNINTLRNVAGQQEQVNRYAAELAKGDVRIAQLRDRQSELRRRKAALENELNALIEKLEF